jgi:hypothetical protein
MPIGLWDVEAFTVYRQSAHRWRWGWQPYAQDVRPLTWGRFVRLISVTGWVHTKGRSAADRNTLTEKSSDIGNWIHDRPARNCRLVFLRSVRRLLVRASFDHSSPILVTLMKEALSSSETSDITRTTRRNIPEDAILHSHCRENLKPYIALTGWAL